MRIVTSPEMPKPAGHYSMCIEHNGLIYLAGQLPKDPHTGIMPEGIEAQTAQALDNVLKIVEAAGSSLDRIIQMRIYIPDIAMWDDVNKVYGRFFGDHKPVRAVIPCRELHYGALLEIEAIAALDT